MQLPFVPPSLRSFPQAHIDCLDVLTAAEPALHEHAAMPHRHRPDAPLNVLVVSPQSLAREALLQSVHDGLPGSRVAMVGSFAEAVLSLAQGGIELVVMDLRKLVPLSPAAPLLLRGLAPKVRLLALGGSAVPTGFEGVSDLAELTAWLQQAH